VPSPPTKTALITGTSGQDGSYLSERLLAEGWQVHGLRHRASSPDLDGQPWADQVSWHDGDLADVTAIAGLVAAIEPDEIYNLAGVTSVAQSWSAPILTGAVTGIGAVGLMEAAYLVQESTGRQVRMLQASSAEIFGIPEHSPQTERTPILPTSPYGAAKAYAHSMAGVYRTRGLGVSACILYNHESPRRPLSFVTRKITRTVAEISLGLEESLTLGNTDSRRDWGWAPDYVDAMVRAVRHPQAADFVIATGKSHSVREFVAAAFDCVGITDWDDLLLVDKAFIRPADPQEQCGDATLARDVLGWVPSVSFGEMVARMVSSDVAELSGQGAVSN
jgi:GDPmannose 4,6-dehydratase